MEPDPLVILPGGNSKKTQKHMKRPSFAALQIGSLGSPSANSPMNLMVCVMCALCVFSSVYSGYRELSLEKRVDRLETELSVLKKSSEPGEVMVERMRRQIEEGFHRRVSREVAAQREYLRDAEHVRTTRDAPECLCPAGRFFIIYHSYS